MADMFPDLKEGDVTIAQKISELERELAMRHSVYPRSIERGQLSKDVAKTRIVILRAIIADYREKQARL